MVELKDLLSPFQPEWYHGSVILIPLLFPPYAKGRTNIQYLPQAAASCISPLVKCGTPKAGTRLVPMAITSPAGHSCSQGRAHTLEKAYREHRD